MSTRDPDNSQNVLIALVLSMLVLFAWQYFYAGPKIEAEKGRIAQQAPADKPADGTAPSPSAAAPQGAAPGAAAPTGAPVAPPSAGVQTTRAAALAR